MCVWLTRRLSLKAILYTSGQLDKLLMINKVPIFISLTFYAVRYYLLLSKANRSMRAAF